MWRKLHSAAEGIRPGQLSLAGEEWGVVIEVILDLPNGKGSLCFRVSPEFVGRPGVALLCVPYILCVWDLGCPVHRSVHDDNSGGSSDILQWSGEGGRVMAMDGCHLPPLAIHCLDVLTLAASGHQALYLVISTGGVGS